MYKIICGDTELYTNNYVGLIPLTRKQLQKYKKDATVFHLQDSTESFLFKMNYRVLRTLLCK